MSISHRPLLFSLLDIEDRAYQIASCSAKTGEGLTDGLEWMVEQISDEEEEHKS